MTRAWAGVDLGTTGVRAVVVDDDGRLLGEGAAPLTGRRDDGRHEQDPEHWWRATTAALGEATAAAGEHADVAGVAVDSTSGTFTLLDAGGRPVAPGLMYDDARAGGTAGLLDDVNRLGAADWATAGYRRMQRSWALPRLVWWLRTHGRPEPGVRLAHQGDVVNERLVGHPVATDTSTALKTGADLHGVGWPGGTLAALGVPPSLLPDVVLPGTVLGHVGDAAAEATGLRAGTPVVAGMTDGCASQLGAGCVTPGAVNAVLGTTLVLKAVAERPVDDPTGVVYSHRSPAGHWLPGGASSTGAGAVTAGLADDDLARLTEGAQAALPTGVLRYPLAGQGERFPFVAGDAHDLVVGQPRDDVEAFAAGLQGVAFAERLCLDRLDLMGVPLDGAMRVTGGGTRNPAWTRLRADVLGRPLERPENSQPALGMAALAAATVGGDPLADVVVRMVRIAEVVEPGAGPGHGGDRGDRLAEGYRRWVGALTERGWLADDVARHALERTPTWA
ncbi:FGGY-family carbohydrate kinase [Nocardioides marinquilinus]|uniref:FGGY-family carbohydrate kinase n=1 Tax=Nocardioides marinquilinus TaxID=1210400 RepID=UPI0031EEA134